MRYHILFSILFFVMIPTNVFADIRITEVAWMGVSGANGQYGEWIELYNSDSSERDLAGWKLYGSGDQLIFTLSKTIPANGYLLVERTTASMPDAVLGIDDERGAFGGGGLSNDGEDLSLRDSSGATIHSLPYASGWPAGDVTTKETMQWDGSRWVTAVSTPKGPFSNSNTEQTNDDTEQTETVVTSTASSSSKKPEKIKHTPRMTINVPSDFFQYIAYELTLNIVLEDGPLFGTARIVWNMGDGTVIKQGKISPILHKYDHLGTYTIWVGYYENIFAEKPYLSVTKTIKVTNPTVILTQVDDRTIELTNQSGKMIDLSGWRVNSKGQYGIIPPFTLLAQDASVTFVASILGFESFPQAVLSRPGGEIMSASLVVRPSVKGATSSTQAVAKNIDSFIIPAEENISFKESDDPQKRNHTKKIIFGVIALTVLALCILLERFMAKQEHLE